VVENGRFGRPRGAGVVMDGDRVEELGEYVPGHAGRALLDQAQAQVDVAEELALVRGEEERPAVELAETPHVMEEGRGHEEVASEALMELGGVAADRRHRDGVLEQAAGVGMVGVGCRGQHPQAGS
jgi:hypothetical protein